MGVLHQQRPPSRSQRSDLARVAGAGLGGPAAARGLAVMQDRPGDQERAVAGRVKAQAEIDVLASDLPQVAVVRPHLVWGPRDTQLVGRIVERGTHADLLAQGGRYASMWALQQASEVTAD